MNEQQLQEHILTILHRIAPEADLQKLNPNQNLREALDIDSFDFLSVVVAVNDQLKIDIPEAHYNRVSTLNTMVEYLKTHLTGKSGD